ncbi:transcriptional regulator family: Centromere protein B DNA-binding region [Penicillium angulare]|uniref:transcriptional regulator family: Centromere protein B DNA-binding region n=1 Tax=Penicillium angulare TaxID=116970 RepID=UPI002540A87C|nr:transcriptional regulator family: Centromere protein B DNA-binding region [Penicillium angulare]KAJ5267318.1 transcriptional regulator family: Centromere protein B DNA-binding region [Penicillium angulare]
MPDSTETEVSRVNEVVQFARSKKTPNLRATSRKFGVNYNLLWRRVKRNIRPKTEVKPSNYTLNVYQEKALGYWIKTLDASFLPPTPAIIEHWANATLARSKTPDRTVGKDWALEGVNPRNIYNFDETGFQIGQGRTRRVFSSQSGKASDLPGVEYGERVTVAECIAADGWRMQPLVIFKGQHHMESWYNHPIPDEWITATAEKGYIIDKLAVRWMEEFDRETRDRVKNGEQRILLVDGCGSHLTFEFLDTATKAGIKIFGFPPNRTNYLQPLDGKPFQAYKAYFKTQNNLISQWGGGLLASKSSFLNDLYQFRDSPYTPNVSKCLFRARNLSS